MKRRKFLAAILAIAMMITSIQLPPVQVSAEETEPENVEFVEKIDATEVNINCNGFKQWPQDGNYYGETELGSSTNGATAEFDFYGNAISVIGTKHSNGGTFDLYIDDVLKATGVETYADGNMFQQNFVTVDGLTLGSHHVRLVVTGDTWVSLDAFEFDMIPSEIPSDILAKNAMSNREQWPYEYNDGKAAWAFMDNGEKHWNTRWKHNKASYEVDSSNIANQYNAGNPIWIQTGFGEPWYITEINYTGVSGKVIKEAEIYIANSAKSIEELVQEDFEKVEVIYNGNETNTGFENNVNEQVITLKEPALATYVRIVVKSGYKDNEVAAKKISIKGYKAGLEVDKTELFKTLSDVKVKIDTVVNKDKLDATVTTAFENAKATYANLNATVNEVNEALSNLNGALELLKTMKREFNPVILAWNAKSNSERSVRQEDSDNNGPAEFAFDDGNYQWHSAYNVNVATRYENGDPIYIQTGFEQKWYVSEIEYTPRSNNTNNRLYEYEIWVANEENPKTSEPTFEYVTDGNLESSADAQSITLDRPVEATHVRIVVKSTHGGAEVTAKNISILGYDEVPVVNKTELLNTIAEAEAIIPTIDDKTDSVLYNSITTALQQARNIAADNNAGQSAVAEALEALNDALHTLKTTLREFNPGILGDNAKANSEQKDAQGNGKDQDGPAKWAFDDEAHWWHTRWSGDPLDGETLGANPPLSDSIWIQTGFDKAWYIKSINYTNRTNAPYGRINEYKISFANMKDPTSDPTDEDFNYKVILSNFENEATNEIIFKEPILATHVRITAVSKYCNVNPADGFKEKADRDLAAQNISIFGYDIKPPANKTELIAAITEAETIENISEYNSDLVTAFNDALTNAETLRDNSDANQSDVDNAAEVLSTALAALKAHIEIAEALEEAIAEAKALYNEADRISDAEGIDPSNADMFAGVKSAIDAGETVTKANTTAEITSARTTVVTAIEDLRRVYVDNSEAKLAGNSLTLEGVIDVNFFMTLSDEVRANKDAYMNFTIVRGEDVEIQTVSVADAVLAGGEQPSNVYVFSCGVPVKDMNTDIKAQLVAGERKGLVYTYSVEEYVTDATTNPEAVLGAGASTEAIAEFKELVTTMSDFGDFATEYFTPSEDGIGSEMLEKISGVSVADLAEYKAAATIPTKDIYYGTSLLLKSDTELRHYFNEEVEVVSVTVDGEAAATNRYAVKQKEGTSKWYLEYTGIGAHELNKLISVTVKTKNSVNPETEEPIEVTIVYSPLTYAHIALKNESTVGTNLANVMRAMYLYYVAADDYIDSTK
ncbi:MAG: discoidin domain-containing protein [Roseburia sp.]|nr:discoidin domain-containing protein [Roseburia sp.]